MADISKITQSCQQYGHAVETGISVIIHAAILFLVLSLFFTFYVSKVITSAFEHELEHLIHKNLSETLSTLPPGQQQQLKKTLKTVDVKKIIQHYSKPDKTVASHNAWLFRTVLFVNIFLVVLIVSLLATSNALCMPIDIKHILAENVAIIVGVGLIEFAFFHFIARKYIPAPPSLMITSIMDSIVGNLE